MRIAKILVLPIVCCFLLLQAGKLAAQNKENDILVMEYGYLLPMNLKSYGIYVFWPDKEVEFTQIKPATNGEEVLTLKKTIYKKINELSDLGWELDIVDNSSGNYTYFFKRSSAQ